MPALSKTSIPSHADMIISRNIVFQSPMLKSNARFYKQARYLNYLDNLNVVSSPVQRSGNPVAYSHQKKCQILVPKGVLNSNPLQNLNNRDEHEFSKWIDPVFWMVLIGKYLLERGSYMLAVLIAQNMLGVLDSQKPATKGQVFLQVSPEMIFTKYPGRFRKSREILVKTLDTFFQQMPTETRRFSKYIEDFCASPEISAILDQIRQQTPPKTKCLNSEEIKLPEVTVWITAPYNPRSQITDTCQLRDEMKRLEMCYLCQEKITKKKFFGERRYGILSNCDCMICYGCIRKTVHNSDGWVKESVICPVCSVESDTFASSHKWVEGQEKLDFFQTYIKNTETIKEARKARPDMIGEMMYSEPEGEQLSNVTKYLLQIFI